MTLEEKLQALKAQYEGDAEKPGMIPSAVLGIMHRATEDLRASGILDRVLKPGDKAPDFTLPNAEGQAISLGDLLTRRPLVINFFRGVW